jgi:4-hydroxyacetophenone monooxygenase
MTSLDRERLAVALTDADIPVLLMSLVHLTGDRRWLRPPYESQRDGRLFADKSGGLPENVQAEVRAAVLDLLTGRDVSAKPTDDDLLMDMMSACVGEPVPAEYLIPVLEDIGIRPKPEPSLPAGPGEFSVTIIGAGISGICAAISLRRLGIAFTVLEKNDSIGGTWFENTYPEAGVDTPNHFYSYSFAPNPQWTWYFSKQPEILSYLQSCVDRFGVRDSVVLNAEISEARYDERGQRWDVRYRVAGGPWQSVRSNVLITAVGQVNRPKIPDLSGKRVAVIGTGASAVQAARTVAQQAGHLTIFQRSPQWIMPNPDYHLRVSANKQYLLENVPFYAAWYRFGLFWRFADSTHASLVVDPDWPHQDRSVNATNDRHREFLTRYMKEMLAGRPDLLAKALPSYPPYGKRMVIDNDWFSTLRRPDVELVADAVSAITETGVRTVRGDEHAADVIALATGFQATRMLWPLQILGRDGVSIHDAWRGDEPRSLLGITTPGFPNMFMLLGPTTALGHGGSVIFHTEAQVSYIMQCLAEMINSGTGTLESKREAADAYTARADEAHESLVFAHKGMNNWYKNAAGRVVTISPWRLVDYWWMTRQPDFGDFIAEAATGTN